MPSPRKERIAHRVNDVVSKLVDYVEDGEFFSIFTQTNLLSEALEQGTISIPFIPIKGNLGELEYYDSFDSDGFIEKYRYQLKDCTKTIRFRFESKDDSNDKDHVHTCTEYNGEKKNHRKPRARPELDEIFSLFKTFDTNEEK